MNDGLGAVGGVRRGRVEVDFTRPVGGVGVGGGGGLDVVVLLGVRVGQHRESAPLERGCGSGHDLLGERFVMSQRLPAVARRDGGAREAFFNKLRGVTPASSS